MPRGASAFLASGTSRCSLLRWDARPRRHPPTRWVTRATAYPTNPRRHRPSGRVGTSSRSVSRMDAMSVWPEPAPKGFLVGVGSHGGPFGVRPLPASCLRVEREESHAVPRGTRVARCGAHLRVCVRRRAAQSSCAAGFLREPSDARRVALSKPGSGRAASKPRGWILEVVGTTFGWGWRPAEVEAPSGAAAAAVSAVLRSRRRVVGIPFGEPPAAGPRFGLRAGPTGHGHPAPKGAGDRDSAAVFGSRAEPGRLSPPPSGRGGSIGPWSQTKPRNFAFPWALGPRERTAGPCGPRSERAGT